MLLPALLDKQVDIAIQLLAVSRVHDGTLHSQLRYHVQALGNLHSQCMEDRVAHTCLRAACASLDSQCKLIQH